MLLNSVASPSLHKKESRYEREQRLKIGSITGYDPRKESATRRLILEDSAYLEGEHPPSQCGTWERSAEARHAYPAANIEHSGAFRNAAGCNITRYSGQHSYSPLSASLSELNLAKCKTPTPISIYNQREEEPLGGGPSSLPGPAGLEKFMSKAKFEVYARNKEYEDSQPNRELTHPTPDESDNTSHRRELQILKDVENRKHNYNPRPSNRSPIELDRYEDFPVDFRPLCNGASFEKFLTQALYDFKAENPRELEFSKGDVLSVTRKVDSNWYEGEFHGNCGIFPISYVASKNCASRSHLSPSTAQRMMPSKQESGGKVRAKYAYKAQSPIELSLNKGDVIGVKRVVDKNWTEGVIGSRVGIFPSSYAAPLEANGKSLSIHTRLKQLPEPPPLKTFERDNPFIKDAQNDISLYRALFNYKPQNEDEVELLEGDMIAVLEKCDDGWFVGTSRRTGAFGTFPGNYVVLV